jgi:hypothetical protein
MGEHQSKYQKLLTQRLNKHQSEYQKLLMERYGHEQDKLALLALYEDPQEEGYEDEMLEWMKEHPDATFEELIHFDFSFYEPLEIVDDDDELDEEDRNPAVYED